MNVYDGDRLLGSVVADANNAWSFTPTTPLADGQHTLTVIATDAVGNVSLPTAGFNLNLDATAPGAPVITSVVDDVGSIQGPVLNGNPTNDNRPTLQRHSRSRCNRSHLRRHHAGGRGHGECPGPVDAGADHHHLTDGVHNFTATATDAAGNLRAWHRR